MPMRHDKSFRREALRVTVLAEGENFQKALNRQLEVDAAEVVRAPFPSLYSCTYDKSLLLIFAISARL